MRTLLIITTSVLGLALATHNAAADPEHQHGAEHHDMNAMDAPTQVLQAYANAIASENVAEMETYVASKGKAFTIFEGKGANVGWADYRDHHLAPEFANPDLTFHTYKYKDIATHTEGDLAFSTFSIEMVYTYKGEDKSRTGHGTAILRRHDNAWKIVHLHTS